MSGLRETDAGPLILKIEVAARGPGPLDRLFMGAKRPPGVVIGVFAKMFGTHERVTEITPTETGYEVGAKAPGDVEKKATVEEGPPRAFVERMAYDGGDLYVIPFMEALRGWLARKRENATEAEKFREAAQQEKAES